MSTLVAVSHERRIHPRFAALSPALVVGERGISGHCLVEDLSSGGARISGAPPLVVGEAVRILLQLPGRRPFSLDGRVVRHFSAAKNAVGDTFAVSFFKVGNEVAGCVTDTIVALQTVNSLHSPAVLVVDNSSRTCLSMVQDLIRVGRKAIAVTTPLDAIEWLLDGGSHFDTALVDMPHGNADGYDLLNFLADEYPEVRRVIMSDTLNALHVERACRSNQPYALLAKPWKVDDLARVFQ